MNVFVCLCMTAYVSVGENVCVTDLCWCQCTSVYMIVCVFLCYIRECLCVQMFCVSVLCGCVPTCECVCESVCVNVYECSYVYISVSYMVIY